MTVWSRHDILMMNRAVQLARKGLYTTRPNPSVGCVITQNDIIVGEGFHQKAGEPHAEVHALNAAKEASLGGTAYVTLEPCSHFGRTPPCAKALIEAGVKRVVVAMKDPNPQVVGRGLAMLTAAGVQVDIGLLESQAEALNPGFIKRMKTNIPLVTVKLAASLDGKTALANGKSQWITGSEARQDVQRLRAKHGALVTGVETVLIDNPSLNVRYDELGGLTDVYDEKDLQQPLRVILDSKARLTGKERIFDIESPLLLVSCTAYPDEFTAKLPKHVEKVVLPDIKGRVDLHALLAHLGQCVNSVMVEAGATLAGAFVEAGCVDEIVLYQAPKLLGAKGRNLLALNDYESMAEIPSLKVIDERKIGVDTRLVIQLGHI
ncbi:bifunctional diaminohydroxyphosphoribosylaminopyrimidine deaminase/5-amino-6-(5-phosphoribosylamino)uracil reductase RibD [Shewanella gelidii]|uniref:Riboflavin biosynthesis protein RibD n=1 Tax=Shewanella gelidii TaxID=1642821 RepID=A0A917N6G6_9GAMM|nr:bifunctional diaminohydroxyphosphoribosylaminopyrimidine deaminase/5-amino-6-(5-phosphoribosylamino)uracil reductase RibD [Shewanella gelidii]MCL1096607.1 bifunctional diaminohydroxyphosphoribosylaminopyrimidine deaminase/5-amino-6-(5-phosphoribosylamino)uracil reductase RibD [Shewanella gelidii]GGI68826.1 riboflavin biosynthesis protein RibD [Shewanella gelidii]